MTRHPVLNRDDLYAAAIQQAECDDWGDTYFEEGLHALLYSLNEEANLHEQGLRNHRRLLVHLLTQRLLMVRAGLARVDMAPVNRPTFIIAGPARTGTTLLQQLLALDPANDFVRSADVFAPIPRTRPGTPRDQEKFAWLQQQIERPEERQPLHYFAPHLPDEETALYEIAFSSLLRTNFAHIPHYYNWYLRRADHRRIYEEIRRMIAFVSHYHTAQRLLLKCPQHHFAFGTLLDTWPNGMVIWTHRDPAKFIASSCSFAKFGYQQNSWKLDRQLLGQGTLDVVSYGIARAMAARDARPHRPICDVQYHDLLRHPLAVVESIYRFFKIELPPSMPQAIQTYLTENPKGKHGKHHYSPTDYNLTPPQIRRRFATYISRFNIPNEE
jgi:hypothetical protein